MDKNSTINKFGIKNITPEYLNFNYDKYYKNIALELKKMDSEEKQKEYRNKKRQEFSDTLDVEVDIKEVKKHFIDIINDEDSSKLLWILYSKYENEENYIDKLSNILKTENKVIRGGTNTYKMNGWMAHTLYVYQIVTDNIFKNELPINFNGREDIENIKNQISELNKIYKKLNNNLVFVVKIFTLIHDIGVIENVKFHNETGMKYVQKVFRELEITDEKLKQYKIEYSLEELIKIMEVFIYNHVLITNLSAEGSDIYFKKEYENLLKSLPHIESIRKYNPEILYLFSYGDIIAVDEKIMDYEKFERLKSGYEFFYDISNNKELKRNKREVAVQRICDTVGKIEFEQLNKELDEILKAYNIDIDDFILNMYDILFLRFAGPFMKTLDDYVFSIRIYAECFKIIKNLESKNKIKDFTILFSPDRPETILAENFKNGNFFKCSKNMIENKNKIEIYENIKIEILENNDSKILQISVV